MTETYKNYLKKLDETLRPGESFDLIRRPFVLKGGREAMFYYIDGFVKDLSLGNIMTFLQNADNIEDLPRNAPYSEVDTTRDHDRLVYMVLSGACVFIIDGLEDAMILDTREYPVRSITEPENDRVLRGPRDGFTETLVFNTALIRRHVRDPALVMHVISIGDLTRTDVVLCYIDGRAEAKFVESMKKKLGDIKIGALNMGQQSIAELLIRKRWHNPFPKLRYTERPDTASAMLLEGSVLVICDNTPSVIILPTSIFDFLQATDDYCFPPLVGTYLRLLRLCVFFITLVLTPVWYLLLKNPEWIPPWLEYIKVTEVSPVPIIIQLFLVEFAIDGLRLASMNTPNALSSSLNIVGGLILGDFAVKVGWLIPEVILYMALVAITNFTQSSYELGYALKFMRMLLLLGVAVANVWGFVFMLIVMIILIATNKSVDGSRSYLYPLIPWNGRAMKRLFFRVKLKENK
ncbi:MAG: spore germination protein [Eubacteriales bacterium]|jgi:stage V sporulation protein AF|nr:spore germination protein [Eubacteriales bacterium]